MEKLNSTHDELVEGLPVEEVHKRAIEARSLFGKAQRALSFWILQMERRKLYSHFGCSSVFHYAELYLELAPHTIAEHLRAGKEMEKLPLLAGAFSEGKISSSKIREISRVATPDTEKAWLDMAMVSTYKQIETMVATTPKGGLPGCLISITAKSKSSESVTRIDNRMADKTSGIGKDETTNGINGNISGIKRCECAEHKALNFDVQISESVPCFDVNVPNMATDASQTSDEIEPEFAGPSRYRRKLIVDFENEEFSILSAALDKARKETGCREKAELLIHIMKCFLNNDSSLEEKNSNSQNRSGSVPYRITLHHMPETNLTWVDAKGARNFVEGHVLSEALCDAEILDLRGDNGKEPDPGRDRQMSVESALLRNAETSTEPDLLHETETPVESVPRYCNSTQEIIQEENLKTTTLSPVDPLRHGPRLRRTLTPTLKRKVFERDMNMCTVPGCTNRKFIHAHHINPVSTGGKDRAENITVVCSRHHREIHKGIIQVTGNAPGNLLWKNKSGEIMKGSCKP